MRISYEKYMRSEAWRDKRRERLKLDKNMCRMCGGSEQLQVHHITYKHFGNEPIEDLSTLCRECHEVCHNHLRGKTYEQARLNTLNNSVKDAEVFYYEKHESETVGDRPVNSTQQPDGRSAKLLCQAIRKSEEQKAEDRIRPSSTC